MRISELKEIKTVRRPTKSFDKSGNRIYEEMEFEIYYDDTIIDKRIHRIFAKDFDFVLIYAILWLIKGNEGVYFMPYLFLYSFPFMILSGTALEHFFGTTLGKFIFDLRVINDFGEKLSMWDSLKRNILTPFTFKISDPDTEIIILKEVGFYLYFKNPSVKSYMVNKKELIKIRQLLKEQSNVRDF